jgi:regulator of sirC expression with transglutaminase-like and TPR domain
VRWASLRLFACLLFLALPCIATDLDTAVRKSWLAKDPMAQLAREVRADPHAYTYTDLAVRVSRLVFDDLDQDDGKAFREELDALAERLRAPLEKARNTTAKARAIARFLYEELGLRTESGEKPLKELPKHYFPHAVLKGKRGVCLGFTMLYLCLAERLDLPLVAAHAPQHIYVKWLHKREAISIETTRKGLVYSNEDFRKRYRLTEDEVKENGYFKPVGRLAVLGDLFNGAAWFSSIGTAKRKLSPERAVLVAQLCVAIEPRNFNNWDTLAQAYSYAGDHTAALAALERTIAMRPTTSSQTEDFWQKRLKSFREAAGVRQ